MHTKQTGSAVQVCLASVALVLLPQPATHFALATTFGTEGRRGKLELRTTPA